MKKYGESINGFRQHILTSQQEQTQGLRQDYTSLEQEIQQTSHHILNETKQLESGIQLDLNMEGKRRAEAKEEISCKTEALGQYTDEQLKIIDSDLQSVSKQARSAVMAFGIAAFISILMYHQSSISN